MQRAEQPTCLLIHGFTSSPREMKNLGDYLRSNGCVVSIPTLPGHDSRPEALLGVRSEEWLRAIEHAYQEAASTSSQIFAIGQSMGAALALHLAANYPLHGVIALATALRLPVWQKLSVYVFSPFIKWKCKSGGPDVRDKAAGDRLQNYGRYPAASLKELLRTMRQVRKELPKVTAPLLILHGRHDQTMSLANVDIVRKNVRSQEIKMEILENSSHILTVDFDHQRVFATVLSFVRRHFSFEKDFLPLKQKA